MRSYREYCAVAKALDAVGDRWSLLIVRELALRGACRYSDLQDGLPGISTNLLADRLRELEQADVVAKRDPRPPVATPLFELTDHGRALVPILRELMGWGVRYMVGGPAPEDHFRTRWLTWPAEMFLVDHEPTRPPATIELRAGDQEPVTLCVDAGAISVLPPGEAAPDVAIVGDPQPILGWLTGHVDLEEASRLGVRYEGDESVLHRVTPRTDGGSA